MRRDFSGSSPLARGTPVREQHRRRRHRFIPARAGNTPARRGRGCGGPVHPRSRGEHDAAAILPEGMTGSSPLARGTLQFPITSTIITRFIPARAGNTASSDAAASKYPVHPRSRGEHSVHMARTASSSGSSPLARGTPTHSPRARRCLRFIPARAGNTVPGAPCACRSAVHPRSRGEHEALTVRPRPDAGSSPLARGTPGPRRPPCSSRRFIPARAGNTRRS